MLWPLGPYKETLNPFHKAQLRPKRGLVVTQVPTTSPKWVQPRLKKKKKKKKSGLATTLAKVRRELSVPPQLSLTLLSLPKTEFWKKVLEFRSIPNLKPHETKKDKTSFIQFVKFSNPLFIQQNVQKVSSFLFSLSLFVGMCLCIMYIYVYLFFFILGKLFLGFL